MPDVAIKGTNIVVSFPDTMSQEEITSALMQHPAVQQIVARKKRAKPLSQEDMGGQSLSSAIAGAFDTPKRGDELDLSAPPPTAAAQIKEALRAAKRPRTQAEFDARRPYQRRPYLRAFVDKLPAEEQAAYKDAPVDPLPSPPRPQLSPLKRFGEVIGFPFAELDSELTRAALEAGIGTKEAQAAFKERKLQEIATSNATAGMGNIYQELAPKQAEAARNLPYGLGGLASFVQNVATPSMLLPIGGVVGLASRGTKATSIGSRVMAGAFAAPMLEHGAEQVGKGLAMGEANPVVEGALSIGLGGLGAYHALAPSVRPPVPPIVEAPRPELMTPRGEPARIAPPVPVPRRRKGQEPTTIEPPVQQFVAPTEHPYAPIIRQLAEKALPGEDVKVAALYREAKKQNPALTKEEFRAQLTELSKSDEFALESATGNMRQSERFTYEDPYGVPRGVGFIRTKGGKPLEAQTEAQAQEVGSAPAAPVYETKTGNGETQAAPNEVGTAPKVEPTRPTEEPVYSLARDYVEKTIERVGLKELPEKEKVTWAKDYADALADKPLMENIVGTARHRKETKQALNSKETAAANIKAMELEGELMKVREQIANETDPGKLETLQEAHDTIEGQFNSLVESAVASGSTTGRALRMLGSQVKRDYSATSILSRAILKAKKKGQELTSQEKEAYLKAAEDFKTKNTALEERIASLEKENADKSEALRQAQLDRLVRKEELAVKRQVQREKRQRAITEIDSDIDALFKEWAEKAGGKASAGVDPTLIPIAGKLLKHYVEKGVVKAAQIVDEIVVRLQELGVEMSHREVRDLLSGYGRETTRATQTETQKRLREVKRELAKISEGEDLAAGETPATQKAYAQRLEKERDALKEELASGNVKAKEAKPRTVYSKEILRLRKQRDEAAHAIERKLAAQSDKLYKVKEIASLPRTLLTSGDISAPGRQGFILSMTHPVAAVRAFKKQLHAFASEDASYKIADDIRKKAEDLGYEESNGYLSPTGADPIHIAKSEENYLYSTLAERLPVVGKIVRSSERAFSTYLNSIRVEAFDALTNHGQADVAFKEAIANYINKATGRGSLGAANKIAPELAQFLFSPRFLASRFQMITGEPLISAYKSGSPAAMRAIGVEYAKFVTAMSAATMVAMGAGAEVSFNPTDSHFLKWKFGKKVIDPLAGMQQPFVFMLREFGDFLPFLPDKMPSSRIKSGESDIDEERTAMRFARSKASPLAGAFLDLITKTDFRGEEIDRPLGLPGGAEVSGNPATAMRILKNMTFPMYHEDAWEAYKDDDAAGALAMPLVQIIGAGANYEQPKPRKTRVY